MKVLFVTATLNERSGWGRLASQLIHHVEAGGVEVVTCCEDEDSPHRLIGLKDGVFRAIIPNIFTVWRASQGVDAIQAIDGWPYAVYAWIPSMLRRKALVVCGVGTYSVAPLKSFFKGALLKRAYIHARALVCISTYTKDKIQELVPQARASVVHMGTTTFVPQSKETIDALRTKLALEGAFPIILTVGRIQDRKDQKSTLRAVSLLKEKYPHIAYIMVGSDDDAYAGEVVALAASLGMSKQIRVVSSARENYSLTALYQLSDITALNSFNDKDHFEGFGLVITEGYQFGKPAVGSRDCGIEDAIEDGVTGYLARQADPADIARAIEATLLRYEELSKNATVKGLEWSWAKMAEAYIDIYHGREISYKRN